MSALVRECVIVGAPPRLERVGERALGGTWLDATYRPTVLASFSPHAPPQPESAIAAFCMPSALAVQREATAPQFACFVLTDGDGTRLYGHCLTVHERLSSSTEVDLGSQAAEPPVSGPQIATVGKLVGPGEACFAPRCVCLISPVHFPLAAKASLLAFHRMAADSAVHDHLGVHPLALPIETSLTHLVLNVPRPVPGGPTVRFILGNGTPALHVGCAPPSQLPSIDYSLCELLRDVDPRSLVSLFQAALLEQQVVVVCDDEQLRLAACELILALLHPFEWAQVYVPSLPDDLIALLTNPFPCILGLRTHQAAQLSIPLPPSMAVLRLAPRTDTSEEEGHANAELTMPSDVVPSLPPREASPLLSTLFELERHGQRSLPRSPGSVTGHRVAMAPPSDTAAPPLEEFIRGGFGQAEDAELDDEALSPELLELRARGAFLRCIVSMLRDLHRFLPEGEPGTAEAEDAAGEGSARASGVTGATDWAAQADRFDRQIERFIGAQPAASDAFLRAFTRTQLFLSFVQPPDEGDRGGGSSGGRRGGRCFQLAHEAFLQLELSQAAARERQHSHAPLPLSAELLGAAAKKTAPDEKTASAPVAAGIGIHDVAPPARARAAAEPSEGYLYRDGLPTELPDELCAERLTIPTFEGSLPPSPRVSAAVRTAWAEALSELEDRSQKRAGAHVAAGVASSLMIGGAATALLCSLQ